MCQWWLMNDNLAMWKLVAGYFKPSFLKELIGFCASSFLYCHIIPSINSIYKKILHLSQHCIDSFYQTVSGKESLYVCLTYPPPLTRGISPSWLFCPLFFPDKSKRNGRTLPPLPLLRSIRYDSAPAASSQTDEKVRGWRCITPSPMYTWTER